VSIGSNVAEKPKAQNARTASKITIAPIRIFKL
jgi:hypothetical protein